MRKKIYKRIVAAALTVTLFSVATSAQSAEGTLSLNEAFFDTLLESVFQNFNSLEFSMAETNINPRDAETLSRNEGVFFATGFSATPRLRSEKSSCKESIRILREMSGVKTSVRFRDGKILVPLAFSGTYSPPFVGCVEFGGWAETNIDLEFNRAEKRLVGHARVVNVNLNGTAGVGGTVIARLIQRSIDKRINPIEIIQLDKLAGTIPLGAIGGSLRMKPISIRPEVVNEMLKIHVTYQFLKD